MGRFASFESSPKLVVLVEDQQTLRVLAAELLRDAAFVVIEAEDARDALKILGLLSSTVDVLFTDLQMPGDMNGLALLCHVHKTWPWISLLLASAHQQPAPADLPPASRFLLKPYMREQMVSQVWELAQARPAAAGSEAV